jgi:hypothetical protein
MNVCYVRKLFNQLRELMLEVFLVATRAPWKIVVSMILVTVERPRATSADRAASPY